MEKKLSIGFAAIDKVIVDNICNADEKVSKAYKWVIWGDENRYPSYLYYLYQNVPTLHSLVDGVVDYIVGDGIESSNRVLLTDSQARKLARSIARSIVLYGGVALNVLRNRMGGIARVVPLDLRCIRTSKDNGRIYYSEKFRDAKSYWTKASVTEYMPFDKEGTEASSILFWKNTEFQTYPSPLYAGAAIACETERLINEYSINYLKNGFSSNIVVNLNNGVPEDEQKEEIERNFGEKFCGTENAGRPVLSFNEDKDHSVSIESVPVENWGEKYKEVKTRARQEIFTAFRANPNLFGIATDSLGFSSEEYESAFKLFNRTVIQPLQMQVCEVLDSVYGEGCITILPYTIDFDGNAQDVEEVENNDVTVIDNE